jgi:hypothetical protein
MRYLTLAPVGTILVASLLVGLNGPTETELGEGGLPPDPNTVIEDILKAEYPYGTASHLGPAGGYRKLFEMVGAEGIRKLEMHPDDGVAIQAAWEEVVLTVPEHESDSLFKPDRDKLNRFLGFLEGRARVRAPKWWAEVVLGSEAYRRDAIYGGRPKENPYHKAEAGTARSPHNTTLSSKDGKVVLHVGEESVAIPSGMLKYWSDGGVLDNVSASVTRTRCYIAVHDDVGFPFHLYCLDRQSDKILWASDVWGTFFGCGATGVHEGWVAVTKEDNRVVVFGATPSGFHVEAFRAKDGRSLFRFSSSYSKWEGLE